MTAIPYKLVRSGRKTVGIQITPAGEVVLRCPRRLSLREAERFLEEKRPWVEAHLAAIRARPPQPKLTEEEVRALIRRGTVEFSARVSRLAPLVGVRYDAVTVRAQKSRWGSCSAKGNLSFNCLLLLCPEAVRDYVVVHELCHRKQMNHSAAFWREVERVLPGFREQRRWLKENGGALIARLPET